MTVIKKVIAGFSNWLLIVMFFALSCSKQDGISCETLNIISTASSSPPCSGHGKIRISSPVGTLWQYKLEPQHSSHPILLEHCHRVVTTSQQRMMQNVFTQQMW